MLIVSWNVNSLRKRLSLLQQLIHQMQPDVLALQETKVQDAHFPMDFFQSMGYDVVFHGQSAYNGVALAARHPLSHSQNPQWLEGQARYIQAEICGVQIGCVYVPNGQTIDSEAYKQKLSFLTHLRQHTKSAVSRMLPSVIVGDFNVALEDTDMWKASDGGLLCSEPEREAMRAWLYQGWTDSMMPGQKRVFTWWDYRGQSWPLDRGLRIDYAFLSPSAADRLQESGVEASWRGCPEPSDHAPIWLRLQR